MARAGPTRGWRAGSHECNGARTLLESIGNAPHLLPLALQTAHHVAARGCEVRQNGSDFCEKQLDLLGNVPQHAGISAPGAYLDPMPDTAPYAETREA